MKTIEIDAPTGLSRILINESIRNLKNYLNGKRTIVITDVNVNRYYNHQFADFEVVEIGTGEGIKNLETLAYIYQRLMNLEVDRSCFIVGSGGGIVCDIAGFAASTYMRGLPFGFVSSSLLSQVDASVGGKNGVNFHGYKNLIGVFSQPSFVICDLEMLKTLPQQELLCGFAELVKHAAIGSAELFSLIEGRYHDALALDMDLMERLVYDSVMIKAEVVRRDEKEKGERRKLNFGHTLGHAVEKTTGLPHGEAVSIGMAVASGLSVNRGHLPGEEADRIKNLLQNFHLPVEFKLDKEEILAAIRKDKKRAGESIHFVFLQGIGRAVVEEIPFPELERTIHDLC